MPPLCLCSRRTVDFESSSAKVLKEPEYRDLGVVFLLNYCFSHRQIVQHRNRMILDQ